MQAKALASGASAPALLRLERGIQFCEEAAQLVLLVEREFDLIEKKYNRLIELKTVFARRALARIHSRFNPDQKRHPDGAAGRQRFPRRSADQRTNSG